jgi:hypothetical protein
MASLCLDDADVFSRLYQHHHTLCSYFKPDEDFDLIYYAIKFQAERCLLFLLGRKSSPLGEVNVSTLFYTLENTRSPKIVRMLLNCGVHLGRRGPATGNAVLQLPYVGNIKLHMACFFFS